MPTTQDFIADWILPISAPPIRHGLIRMAGARIVELRESRSEDQGIRLPPHAMIVPGFVNAHTHLEFSNLRTPLGRRGIGMSAWIRDVLRERARRAEIGDVAESRDRAILDGLAESERHGVSLLAEISIAPWDPAPYRDSRVASVLLLEQLGMREDTVESRKEELWSAWERIAGTNRGEQVGVSPHAPYSLHPRLFESIMSLAIQEDALVAMHLAESREEIQFLETGHGPFREFLTELNLFDPAQRLCSIDYCLDWLSRARRGLVIHGNYLRPKQLDWIASFPEMTIVYCPRTHDYFGHDDYPLAEMLKRGIRVAIGTDSRASNPDLDLLAELRMVAAKFPELSAATILEMGTARGAEALGLGDRFGVLRVGGEPGVLAIEFNEPIGDDPAAALLHGCVKSRYWLDRA